MTDATLDGELPLSIEPSYLGAGHSLASWLTSTDHKRIAILYAISITFFFFLGGIAISIVRMELFTPEPTSSRPIPITSSLPSMASSWFGFSWCHQFRRRWEISCFP